jgi:hypothetical protein
MELQETLLRQVLRERGTSTQQAFKEPAEARIKLLKQHGELFVFAPHKLRYVTKTLQGGKSYKKVDLLKKC